VEVSRCQGYRIGPGWDVGSRLERAVTLSQQDSDRASEEIGHGEVQDAVAVEIACEDGVRFASGGEVAGGLQGAVAVAQQHAHAAGIREVGDGQVRNAIAVEIAYYHGNRTRAGVEAQWRQEA